MKTIEVNFIKGILDNTYKVGYLDGKENAKADNAKAYEMLQKQCLVLQRRAQWWQEKYNRMKENYVGQVKNLLNKVNYYEELLHRTKTEYIDTYTDMKGD